MVPTKVTAHGGYTDDFGKWEVYYEFWNVGKLGGEQYAKATMREVCIEKAEGVQGPDNFTIVAEGYFTGGPNGDFYLTLLVVDQTIDMHSKINDGKEVIPGDWIDAPPVGTLCPTDNPGAFDGWID